MKLRHVVGTLLAVTTLGTSFVVGTVGITAQAKAQTVKVTETKMNGKRTITYNGQQYTPVQAVKLGLLSDNAVNAKENRWTYKLANVHVKRTKSGKSVKVTGKLVVTNIPLSVFTPAKQVQISTHNDAKFAPVTKKLTFSKVVKTTAKKVNIRAGYHGKVKGKSVFFVLSANKTFKVHAYK